MANYGKRSDGTILTTQWETVLYYLKENPGVHKITAGQAWFDYGFSRLGSIVCKIEHHTGIRLARKMKKVKSRYGGDVHIMEYWYQKPDDAA